MNGWQPENKVLRRYSKTDSNGKKYREIDLRKTGDGDRRVDRPNLFYYFMYNPDTNDLYPTKEDKKVKGYVQIYPQREDGSHGRWRWELDTALKKLDRLVPKLMRVRQVWTVFETDYLDPNESIKPTSAWTQKEVNSERGSEQFIDLGFRKEVFPRPKPTGLLKLVLQLGTSAHTSDIVVDFFAGSCTMGQATFELNLEDNGNRRFVLVQLAEPTPDDSEARADGYTTIAAIGKERIRRAIGKYEASTPLDSEAPTDLGFRTFQLSHSNFTEWHDYSGENIQQFELAFEGAVQPLVKEWEFDDVVTEIQLLEGFSLDSFRGEMPDVMGNKVLRIASDNCSHRLLICLDARINEDLASALELQPEDVFVCLDSALTDEVKVRMSDLGNLRTI